MLGKKLSGNNEKQEENSKIRKNISIQLFSNSFGEDEIQAIRPVFESRWTGMGNETKMLEKELGEKWDCPRTLVVNCCTAALFMSMKILGIRQGDEVIIPSIHFIGAVNAIFDAGAKPVFADVDIKTLNILPEEIERLRTENTKAVMVLHYGGHPCDMDEIMEIAKKYNLYVIEDNANSPFSTYKGKYCGTIGDVGCTSFESTKIMCMGDGGAITLKTDELYKKAIEYRYFGLKHKGQSGIDSFKEGAQKWWEIELNCLSNRYVTCDILSAIGRVQLKKADKFIKRRKEIWDTYQKGLSELEWLETPPEPSAGTTSSYYFYWIKAKNGKRDKLAKHLVENGVYCTFRYYPLHLIKRYNSDAQLPNSELLNETVLDIPLHQNLSEGDMAKILYIIKRFK